MLNVTSLYDQKPEIWQRIASLGCKNIAEMSRHFARCSDMDRALGLSNASAKWMNRNGVPRVSTEALAKLWMQENVRKVDAAPVAQAADAGVILLVACDAATAGKAKRLLFVLGCDVTEV